MSFITFSLFLGGLAATSIPVLLHFLMRGKPKQIEFPALMFVKKRLDVQRRNYQLKHLILLLLRIATFVLIGLALARPTIKLADWIPSLAMPTFESNAEPRRNFVSRLTTSLGSQEAPIAAVLVVDSSIRMQYRAENQTRLDVAKDFADWILRQLPAGSSIGVLSSHRETPVFQVDVLAAGDKIKRLQVDPTGRKIIEAVSEALALLLESDTPQCELYILTDLSEPGWPENLAESIKPLLERFKSPRAVFSASERKELGIFVVDVGVSQATDSAVSGLNLSSQVVAPQSTVYLEVELSHLGSATRKTVDLLLLNEKVNPSGEMPESIIRDTRTIDFPGGESRRRELFVLSALESGVHQGQIRFSAPDALPEDDGQFFSISVHPPTKILLFSQIPVRETSLYLREALELVPFDVHAESFTELFGKTQKELQEFRAVVLLDPPPQPPAIWKKLSDFAVSGAGVGVILGPAATSLASFNDPSATEVLGAKLVRQARNPEGELWLIPENEATPLLNPFRQYGSLQRFPWSAQSVFRYWELADLNPTAEVDFPFSDQRPAIVTQTLGKGRTLTLATPVSELADTPHPWNRWTHGESAWMFVMLAEGIAKYLVGTAEMEFNFPAGEPIVIRSPGSSVSEFPPTCLLRTPSGQSLRLTTNSQLREVRIPAANEIGNYRLRSGGAQESLDLGFSVNISEEETQIRRIDRERLDRLFGEKNYRLVRTPEEVEQGIARRRIGQEFYTPILLLLVTVFVSEYIFSNRFYQSRRTIDN